MSRNVKGELNVRIWTDGSIDAALTTGPTMTMRGSADQVEVATLLAALYALTGDNATSSAAPACTPAPVVPPRGHLLNPEAYSKSEPYWTPGSPQRLHLIDLAHQRAQQLQLPKPSWSEIDALLNPFASPVHEKLAEIVRYQYGLMEFEPTK